MDNKGILDFHNDMKSAKFLEASTPDRDPHASQKGIVRYGFDREILLLPAFAIEYLEPKGNFANGILAR